MRPLRFLVAAASLLLSTVSASSVDRNPLHTLGVIHNPSILTNSHRVTAVSSFDLAFDIHGRRIRLSLEPNHDIIHDNAHVTYLDAEGLVTRSEPLNRLDYKVFKGHTWVRSLGDKGWDNVGWARISVRRDGVNPLFEGAFAVGSDHHHVQLSSNYIRTRHELDPRLQTDDVDDDFMVCFRDSDISKTSPDRADLRRAIDAEDSKLACRADGLDFNSQPDHPVYAALLRRDQTHWTDMIPSLFRKRQIDNSGGNSAGVNLVSSIGSTAGCPTTRKVALVGVAADCNYAADFNGTEAARQNIIAQMNSASSLYESTFQITLGLANLTVSDRVCPGTASAGTPWNLACSPNVDISARLNLFSGWRGQQVDRNSHWTLLSKCPTGSAVGLAWLGQACVEGSMGNNASGLGETVAGANVVVRTSTEWQVIAHETGHTFGAVHDCTVTTCADGDSVAAQKCCPLSAGTCDAGEQFIMNPSTATGITKFSACSIGNICSAMGRQSVKTTCFTNNKDIPTITGQQCGNGIVEEGEDCDCGGDANCAGNKCCNPTTCKFTAGSVCDDSNEDCCNNCQLASASTICRASTGECDPAETCTGTSPYCPEDNTSTDGTACGGGGGLSCTSGQCTSRDMQCKTVMGSYTQGNDTYACDRSGCSLSCASPEFGRNVCYGLQQNFLDGTECSGGGRCDNGQCKGSSFTKEVGSWIAEHKTIVIGIGAGIGGLVLLLILNCIWNCCRRKKQQKRRMNDPSAWPAGAPGPRGPPGPHNGPPPSYYHSQPRGGPAPSPYGNIPQPPPQMAYRTNSMRYA